MNHGDNPVHTRSLNGHNAKGHQGIDAIDIGADQRTRLHIDAVVPPALPAIALSRNEVNAALRLAAKSST
jgi:hypothetical protein